MKKRLSFPSESIYSPYQYNVYLEGHTLKIIENQTLRLIGDPLSVEITTTLDATTLIIKTRALPPTINIKFFAQHHSTLTLTFQGKKSIVISEKDPRLTCPETYKIEGDKENRYP